MTLTDTQVVCLLRLNPLSGFVGQHSTDCARIQEHLDGEIRINGHASHHALFGVSKDHPHGSSCMNICGSCVERIEKRSDVIVSVGMILNESKG